jgi:suppressor for copper-sensitivity B
MKPIFLKILALFGLLISLISSYFPLEALANNGYGSNNSVIKIFNKTTEEWHKINDAVEVKLATSIVNSKNSTDNSKADNSKDFIIAITFKIAKDWKIYGQESSSIGTPPQFYLKQKDKDLSSQIKILWPEAKPAEEKIGNEVYKYSFYKDLVTIPIVINSKKVNSKEDLELTINLAICKEICAFITQDFNIELPQSNDQSSNIELATDSNKTASPTSSATEEVTKSQLILFCFFAIIGGMILNIMPCVLPILSIKILSFIKYGKSTTEEVRFAFLAIIAGIVSSFFVFSVIAIAIKSTGSYLGWGLQFQNPYFLIFLLVILVFFILTLLDLLTINVDTFAVNWLNKKSQHQNLNNFNHEKNLHRRKIFISNFFSGILAVMLATPCSAPFLGTAISFALTQNEITIFTIVMLIGLGFCTPYLLVAINPRLVCLLPKPGKWMLNIKKIMVISLIITTLWIAYLITKNLGYISGMLILTTFAVTILLLKLQKPTKSSSKISKNILQTLLLINILLLFALPAISGKTKLLDDLIQQVNSKIFNKDRGTKIENNQINWQKFDRKNLEQLAKDNIVIIDITADWCITCKINKIRVFQDKEIIELIKEKNIIMIQGDITKNNPEITDFMKENNRFAIPFNAVYGPKVTKPIVTSEILNKEQLKTAINKVK